MINEEEINNLFNNWLNDKVGEYVKRIELIDKCCVQKTKEAFVYAYKLGFESKIKYNWEELNQK